MHGEADACKVVYSNRRSDYCVLVVRHSDHDPLVALKC